ncbi:MAG: iron ABC transporter permease [Clostridia bacterium]|nr:iron ABC transporter permease [Clostridia bacterium]
MKRRFAAVVALLILAVTASLCFGAVPLSPAALFRALTGDASETAFVIVRYSRLPRTVAAVLAGAALSVSGCLFQTVLGNKLASPGIIGVNAGAALAVAVCASVGVLSGWLFSAAAFMGALFATGIVMLIAWKTGASRTTIILSGVALNSILNAFRDALHALFPAAALTGSEFRVGGFSAVVPARLLPAAVLIALGLAFVFLSANDLDVLSLGEDTAKSLGLRVGAMRTLFLTAGAMLAGCAVSFAGTLSFVGLLVPHIARRLIGTESAKLLPFCALGGAAFLTACDLLSRVMFAPYELPVGIIMSVAGGPFFLYLLIKNRGGHAHA